MQANILQAYSSVFEGSFAFSEGKYLDIKQMKQELQTEHKILVMEAAADQRSATRVLEFSEYPVADTLLIKITG